MKSSPIFRNLKVSMVINRNKQFCCGVVDLRKISYGVFLKTYGVKNKTYGVEFCPIFTVFAHFLLPVADPRATSSTFGIYASSSIECTHLQVLKLPIFLLHRFWQSLHRFFKALHRFCTPLHQFCHTHHECHSSLTFIQ